MLAVVVGSEAAVLGQAQVAP
eukprot:COSAG06_NODE_20428_length_796_cov_1.109039_1_plen_20_part_01